MNIEDFLLQVHKPQRYIGREWNSSKKSFDAATIRFALSFPDLYEVGMSNLGLRILYGILNSINDVACERVFAPAKDMEDILRQNNLDLFSLESRKSIKEFDILGFSLGYELCYTNVLNILELGKIPLKAQERDASFPLIIGGGPCVANPEPLAEFFDIFFIGEAEEAVVEIIDLYRKNKDDFKAGNIKKEALLKMFSEIEGVYVPLFYEVSYAESGAVLEFKPKVEGAPLKIKKRIVGNLDEAPFPTEWLVPYTQIIHDRACLEIMRGCPNQCRFCQARTWYYPFRQRKVDTLVNTACQIYQNSGYEEISMLGLSSSDHPHIDELLEKLLVFFKDKKVSLSLPSIKPRLLVGKLATLIASIKKTGLTFAPEAASEKLRRVVNKEFSEADFSNVLEEAFRSGYQHLKLYFMIGIPLEENEDLEAIAKFVQDASSLRKKTGGGAAEVNVSINTLIPKPHTPFQWFGMIDQETIRQKQSLLRGLLKNRKVKLSFHHLEMSNLEAIFSRGDRRLSAVILEAYRRGARFDAWSENFDFSKWLEAFQAAKIDPSFYLRSKAADELLPWDFIDVGVEKKFLLSEYNKIIA